MERTRDGSGYGRAVTVRAAGPSAAAALGASGVVIRSISTSDERFPHTGALRYNADVAAHSGVRHFQSRRGCAGAPVRERQTRATAHVEHSRDLPQASSANVIGEVPGTERASEIVILGAHLDSWDPGVGAIDDGAGVAIMMSAAKLIQDLGQQAAAHDSRGAVRQRGIRNLRLAGLPRGEPGGGQPACARLRGGFRRRTGVAPI